MIKIRKAEISDALGIGIVHIDSWLSTYRGIIPDERLDKLSYDRGEVKWNNHIKQSIINKEEILLVAEEDQKIIGFCYGGLNKYENPELAKKYKADLQLIYLLKEYQKKGVGKRLIFEFVKQIQNIGFHSMIIWVLDKNSSKGFYEKLGGKVVAEKIYDFGKKLKALAFGWEDLSHFNNIMSKDNSKKYWNQIFDTSDYDYKKLARKDSWQSFIDDANKKNIKSVLDLGSGGGHWSIILARTGIKEITAVDFSDIAISKLIKWAEEENLIIKTKVCSIQDYYDSCKYDMIICNSVLDHLFLTDIKKVLKNIANMLDKKGSAYISFDALEENDDDNNNYILLENGYRQYSDGMIWKYFNEDEIRDLLSKYFVIDKFIGTGDSRKNIMVRRK